MKKIEFGFIQGRMTSPPSKKILQYFTKKIGERNFIMQIDLSLISLNILVRENLIRATQFGIKKI